ncbi:hypothetical protein J6590_015274 [Homalodisca vitripennis]|nr:hypothetical protein J6590_015274 [Homalodisca vitripennis]
MLQLYRSSSFNSSGRSSTCDTADDIYSDVSLEEDVLDLNHKECLCLQSRRPQHSLVPRSNPALDNYSRIAAALLAKPDFLCTFLLSQGLSLGQNAAQRMQDESLSWKARCGAESNLENSRVFEQTKKQSETASRARNGGTDRCKFRFRERPTQTHRLASFCVDCGGSEFSFTSPGYHAQLHSTVRSRAQRVSDDTVVGQVELVLSTRHRIFGGL